MTKLVGVIWLS